MKTKTFLAEHASLEKLRDIINARKLLKIEYEELIAMLHDSQAIYVNGHWELLSGNHTDLFFQFSKLAQYPKYIEKITREILEWIHANFKERISVALSPAAAGRSLAFSIAAALNGEMNTRLANAATDSLGKTLPKLKEGYEIHQGENVLLVNDLITTGDGIIQMLELVRLCAAKPLAVCVFANRSLKAVEELQQKTGLKVYSMIDIKAGHWPKLECPLCKQGTQYRHSYQYHV